jgi:hypothetical protein
VRGWILPLERPEPVNLGDANERADYEQNRSAERDLRTCQRAWANHGVMRPAVVGS